MKLPFLIAVRYLFAKKSHNVINLISGISAAGMAVGTAALIIIISVYNGFDLIVRQSLGTVEPDVKIAPAAGKVFSPVGEAFDWAYEQESVLNMSSVLEENVYLSYDSHSTVARAKGVDAVYEEESPIAEHLVEGKFSLWRGSVPQAVVGAGLAYKLDISPRFRTGLEMYYPARDRNFSMANPATSLESIKVFPSGVFSVNAEIDNTMLFIPLEKMRELLGYDGDEVSAVEIRFVPGTPEKERRRIMKGLSERLGTGFTVMDRYMQNEGLYKMIRYEKASIYLILMFIIIIIAFNIFSSLRMLIIEKEEDIRTLRCLGAGEGMTRSIFVLEGWMISLLGMAAGVVSGIVLCLLQQQFGIIKMPGGFMTSAYPVVMRFSDILLTALGVAGIGYVIALAPSRIR